MKYILSVSFGLMLSALASSAYGAGGDTWTGTTDTSFETSANWSAGTPTNDTTTTYAIFAGAPTVNQPTVATSRSIAALQFGSTSGWNLGGATTLTLGAALTVGTTTNVGIDASALTSGTDTISESNLYLNNGTTGTAFLVGTGGTLALNSSVKGVSGALLVAGDASNTGTVILGGSVANSVNLTVNGGTVQLNKTANVNAASQIIIQGGGKVQLTGTGTDQIYDSGTVTVGTASGAGTFDLNGHNETFGALASASTVTTGIVDNSSASAVTMTLHTNLSNQSYYGNITDSGGAGITLVKTGVDTQSLFGSDDLVAIVIKSGTLGLKGETSAGSGTITIGDTANPTSSATLALNGSFSSTAPLTNAINVVAVGTIASVTGTNVVASAITLNGTPLTISNTSNSGNTTTIAGSITGVGNLNLQTNGALTSATSITMSGNINNTGTLSNNGTATTTASKTARTIITGVIGSNVTGVLQNGSALTTLVMNGPQTYTVDTTVTAGTLELDDSLGVQSSTVNMNGGNLTFKAGLGNATIGGLSGTANVALSDLAATSAAVALTIGNNNKNTAYSGSLSGLGSLTKIGTGITSLNGASTYTGVTNVNAGTLLVNNTTGDGVGAGTTTVNAGAVLGGSGVITSALSLNSGATLLAGTGTSTGETLTLSGATSLSDNINLEFVLGPSLAHSTLASTTLSLDLPSDIAFTFIDQGASSGVYDNIMTGISSNVDTSDWTVTNGGYTATFTYDGAGDIDMDLTIAAVPEPGSFALMLAGAIALIGLTTRRHLNSRRLPSA